MPLRPLFALFAAPRIIGSVDGPFRSRLHGWVIDRTMPLRRLTVEIRAPSGHRLAILADRYRADVQQNSDLGDGYCGFSVPLHRLEGHGPFRIVCTDPAVTLGMIDLSHIPAPRSQILFERSNCILAVDTPIIGHISGWAANSADPMSRRLLRLRSDGCIVAQQRATVFREDAAKVLPDGYHGFRLSAPATAKELMLDDIETGSAFAIRC